MTGSFINISVFTPTYNRVVLLERLYVSLINQTNYNFEWIIVDDGSSDDTLDKVNKWIAENKIKITYYKQENRGKHTAINKGVSLAKNLLFFIVDSDDYLLPCSIAVILQKYECAKKKYNIDGIAGRRQYQNGNIVGNLNFNHRVSDSIRIRYTYNVTGDLVEIYELQKIKQYPFPEFKGEKFCPEALIWNRLALKFQLFFFNEGIYVTEYLPGGLTDNIAKIRMQSPFASMLYYSELEKQKIPNSQKLKANINFWRFSYNNAQTIFAKIRKVSIFNSIIGIPIGYLMYLKDKKKR